MSCCAPGNEGIDDAVTGRSPEEIRLASRPLGNGLYQVSFAVPGMHCGACMNTVEKALLQLDGVERARANLSLKRVNVQWRGNGVPPPMLEALDRAGYRAHLHEAMADEGDAMLRHLIRAIAVSGFAAANIMLLSVSVWSGAEDATRDLFHWISALIALPAIAYSGGIFFKSAWGALRARRLNMDVPISLAVILAFTMSLYETINHGEHAYFDAAVTLMFFLLIGRTLDHVMRERARSAVTGLARMSPRGAVVVNADGSREYTEVQKLEPGMHISVAAGERFAVDGSIESGSSEADCSIATGESAPVPISAGSTVRAGTLNLTGPVTVVASAKPRDSFLAEMQRLMEAAEGGQARYRRIADRAAEIYSPAVHATAALTFIAWFWISGDLHHSVYTAIAVLIITCPCALGLAVPVVQVVAARRLFDAGIMVKDGGALERLGECTRVVFDKTGTLTSARAMVANAGRIDRDAMAIAAAIAAGSKHPYSRAIAECGREHGMVFDAMTEYPGLGVEARLGPETYRLGRAEWALREAGEISAPVVLSRDGAFLAGFEFTTALRADAEEAVLRLQALGLAPEMLSGDRTGIVAALAGRLGIERYAGEVLPAEKLERLETLRIAGEKVLMVGDGINDAPALAAAHVSMAPSEAADIGRRAAGFVFLHDSLLAVPQAVGIARNAASLIRQNFALAAIYNLLAVPAAVFGFVTPLVAALAMSASSIVVISNSLRLRGAQVADRTAMSTHRSPSFPKHAGVPAE